MRRAVIFQIEKHLRSSFSFLRKPLGGEEKYYSQYFCHDRVYSTRIAFLFSNSWHRPIGGVPSSSSSSSSAKNPELFVFGRGNPEIYGTEEEKARVTETLRNRSSESELYRFESGKSYEKFRLSVTPSLSNIDNRGSGSGEQGEFRVAEGHANIRSD